MPATTHPPSTPEVDPMSTPEHPSGSELLPATMQAVVADRYGSPDVLQVRTVDRPTPGSGEVLVKVAAAGLSRAALHLLTGTPYLLRLAGFGLLAPKYSVGVELAGTVVAIGPGVTRFAIGDEVFGYARGTCVEFAVAKQDKLALRPKGVTPTQAAALVDSASTALQAVRDHGGVQAGHRVLVLGASGGVGSFAVQIAKALGATVTGTASPAKLAFVRGLGADEVVDYIAADPLAADRPYDVIIDIGGNRPVKAMRRALADDGTLVIVGGEGGGRLTGGIHRQLLAPLRAIGGSQAVKMFVANEHHRFLDDLAAMVTDGQLSPAIDQTHPLADTRIGLDRMAAGTILGKDVVEIHPVR